eukprot:TRINITY_DN5415_c0_g1_i1.p1 TRINITY_DN5415_c0_g1~~TRINITY_DN5415_c0_g1_i1.p1  ORF type:complete len:632 (+),score=151.04 TRINITY_DN5415_c0_g1_i1:34-1896(+)
MTQNYGLTYEQDKYLKKQLFTYIITKEIRQILENPSIEAVNKTRYLNFMFQKFVSDFPLLKSKDKTFWEHVNQLIQHIHSMRLSNANERGKVTTTDKFWRRIEKIVVIAFRNIVRTPVSTNAPETENSTPIHDYTGKTPEEIEIIKKTDEFINLLHDFMSDLVEKGSGTTITETIIKEDNINNLPPNYKNLVSFGSTLLAHGIYVKLHVDDLGESRKSMLYKLHALIPFGTLGGLLNIMNPIKLVRGIMDLFFVKPLGGRNLAQRMVKIVLSAQHEGEAEGSAPPLSIKELRKKINDTKIFDKVHNYVNRDVSELPPRSAKIQDTSFQRVSKMLESSVDPELPPGLIKTLSTDQIANIYHLILQETRVRDYELMSSALGDDKVISTIKEMISVFFDPLIEVYAKADVHFVFNTVSKFLKSVIDIAYQKKEKNELVAEYKSTIDHMMKETYTFLHQMVVEDNKSTRLLTRLMDWFMQQLVFFKKNSSTTEVDLGALVKKNLSSEEQETLLKELDGLAVYFHLKKEERRQKLIEMINVKEYSSTNTKLFEGYISEEDIEDINFDDLIEDEEDGKEGERRSFPKLKSLPKLIGPFQSALEDTLLVSQNQPLKTQKAVGYGSSI